MKRLFSFLISAALILSLAGCGGGKSDTELTAVLPGSVSSLDPQTASGASADIVIGSIFEGLCRLDENSELQPGVANRWEHNKDFTQFTFRLRSAKWSNGEAVIADDFVFGITRALRHDTGLSSLEDLFIIKNARAFYNGEADEESLGVYAKNEKTLVIELERSYADFPVLTAGNHYMPCSRAFFEECAGHYGLSGEFIITNGPFTLPHIYAWNTDYNEQSVSLTRFEGYRGENKAQAASLTYLIDYDDVIDTDPVKALVSGAADILEVSESEARAAEEQGCGVLALDDGVTGLLLNPDCDNLNLVKMRELFIKTLNRENILAQDVSDTICEAPGIMPGCIRRNEEEYYADGLSCYAAQDDEITEAIPLLKSLLKLEKIPSITVLCPNDERSIAVANSFLITWNEKLGNAFNILPMSESELKSRVASGDYEAALYTLRAKGVTPFDIFGAFESSAYPTLLNDEGFDNALRNANFDLAACGELESMLLEEYVFYPVFTAKSYYAMAPGVSKITVSPDLRINFSKAERKK